MLTELWAWIGVDERGSGHVGLKQAKVPAGLIPMVATSREKIDRPGIREQLQLQADFYHVTIRLARFTLADDNVVTLEGIDPATRQ